MLAAPKDYRMRMKVGGKSGGSVERKASFLLFSVVGKVQTPNTWKEKMMGSPRDIEAL